jgi:hypothetical protein
VEIESNKALALNFLYTIQLLGNLLGGMYLEKYFYEIGKLTKESDFKGKPMYVQKQLDENILKEFVIKINEGTITDEDYKEIAKPKIKDYAFDKFINLRQDKKVFDYLNASIYLNELAKIDSLLIIDSLTLQRDTFNLNLGIVLFNEMLTRQLLVKELTSKDEDKNAWVLLLGEALESQFSTSAVLYKPRLVDFKIDTSYLNTLDKLELKVSLEEVVKVSLVRLAIVY